MAKKQIKTDEVAPLGEQPRKAGKGRLVVYFLIFIFGFVSGIAFTVYKGSVPGDTTSLSSSENDRKNDETDKAILSLEAEVTANPDNYQNWISLGHLYYDTNQPEKAIGAYNKSLELHAGDANLLTDLGVMYRRAKQPEKAIEQFDLAISKDPSHLPSRFNKGIVLMYDMGDTEGAIATWEEVLKINPQAQTSTGEPLAEFVKHIKEELSKKN